MFDLTAEPGANYTEILNGIKYVRPGHGYEPDPRIHFYNKLEINGEKEDPMFTFLKVNHQHILPVSVIHRNLQKSDTYFSSSIILRGHHRFCRMLDISVIYYSLGKSIRTITVTVTVRLSQVAGSFLDQDLLSEL